MLVVAVLYALALGVLLVYGLNHLALAWRFAREEGRRTAPPPRRPRTVWPTVTVQLPLYNERAVAERLIDACAQFDYPADRFDIQVLDDSTDVTRDLVARRVAHWQDRGVRIQHHHRTDRSGFKAGALAEGLKTAPGEYVAIFDADFVPPPDVLTRLLDGFQRDGVDDPEIGLVQARWGHLNAKASWLTRAQALLLDAHFVVEQGVRSASGWLINFNGTAGLWRRACIDEAGGWRAATLTEDLDLSIRAQLAGWRLRYVGAIEVAAELPETFAAWRQQQFRWTKGTAETAKLLAAPVWRAPLSRAAKTEALLHLTSGVVYPAILLAALTHPLVLVAHALDQGVSDAVLALMAPGVLGLAGVAAAHLLAQHALYPDALRRMLAFPLFLASTLGLAVSNTRGVLEALRGRTSAFVRTPKQGDGASAGVSAGPGLVDGVGGDGASGGGAARSGPASPSRRIRVRWIEAALALYSSLGLMAILATGVYAALPFQVLFALGFAMAAFGERTPRATEVPTGEVEVPTVVWASASQTGTEALA
ncbi:MAG: glycosyltransferase [Bacteroidota bacterium]